MNKKKEIILEDNLWCGLDKGCTLLRSWYFRNKRFAIYKSENRYFFWVDNECYANERKGKCGTDKIAIEEFRVFNKLPKYP